MLLEQEKKNVDNEQNWDENGGSENPQITTCNLGWSFPERRYTHIKNLKFMAFFPLLP